MDQQEISENTGNIGRYEKALEFLGEAGHLSDEKFYRHALRNAESLIEIFQGTRNALEFLTSKQIDYGTIIESIKTIFYRLHFNPNDDYYLAMLLPRYAEELLIHKRWKRLMLIYHPDRKTVSSDYAAECTKRLNDVFHVLKDPMRKYAYDQQLAHPERSDPERPSSFKQPRKGPLFFGNGGRPYSKTFLLSLLIAAVALAAGFYFGRSDQQMTSFQEVPRPVAKGLPAIEPSHEKTAKQERTSRVTTPKNRTKARPNDMKHDILLAEEVYGFVSRLTQAYEAWDVDAYLSCYSPTATENGMEYARIGTFYKTLFEEGRSRYSIGNLSIREESGEITVNGVFTTGGMTEGNADIVKGTIAMTLMRIDGELKIINALKVKDETHSDN